MLPTPAPRNIVKIVSPVFVLAAFLAAATIAPLWMIDRFPGQDTPNHLYALHVLEHRHEGAFASRFTVHRTATTNIAFQGIAFGLARVFDLDVAHRIFLSLYVVAFMAGALYLAGSMDHDRTPLGLLAFPFALNWYVTSGFYGFCLTIPVYCVAVGLALRHPDARPRGLATLSFLGLLMAVGHPFTVVCAAASVVVVLPTWRGRIGSALAFVPALALVAAGIVSSAGRGGFDWPTGFPSPLYSLATGFYRFALPIGPGELAAAAPAFLLLVLPAVLTVWSRRAEVSARGLRLSAMLFVLFLLLPERSFGFDHISTRVTGFVILSLLVWTRVDWLTNRRRLFFATTAILSVLSSALFLRSAREVDADLAEYTGGLAAVEPETTLLPLNFDARSGRRVIWPLLHAWGYYGIARNVVSPYVLYAHAERPASWLAYRGDRRLPPAPDEFLPERLVSGTFCDAVRAAAGPNADCAPFVERAYDEMMAQACAYDQVLAWAAPPDLSARLARCFDQVFVRGRLSIYRRR